MENTEKQAPKVSIDGVEYDPETFTDNQKTLLNHVMDMEQKLAHAKFNLDQVSVGRDAFFNMLKQSLEEKTEDVKEKAE
jgi:hypothetical protein